MVRFKTQAEVLKYLGKDTNQRVYISRMIKKGLIEKESGGYTVKEEVIPTSVTTVTSECNNSVTSVTENELLDHLAFLYTVNDEKLNALNNLIKLYYDRDPNRGWDYAEERVRKSLQWEENPDEKEELEYIKTLIS